MKHLGPTGPTPGEGILISLGIGALLLALMWLMNHYCKKWHSLRRAQQLNRKQIEQTIEVEFLKD